MLEFFEAKLSIIGVWKKSFILYKKAFIRVWYIGIITVIPQSIYYLCMKKKITSCFIFHLTYANYSMVAVIINLFIEATLLYYLYNFVSDPKTKLAKSIKYVSSKYILIFVTTITIYFAIAKLIKVIPLKNHLFAFAITYVVIYTIFVFNKLAILFDNAGYFRSFKISIQLVWKNWFRTFAVFLPMAVIGLIQTKIFTLGLPYYLMTSIFWILIYPYLVSLILVQFNDLKLRHQADLD